MTRRLHLGSARVSRAGFDVSPKRTFVFARLRPEETRAQQKFAIARTQSPARETRALPGMQIIAILALVFVTSACRKGMVDQQRLKPLAEESFFADGRGSRMPPTHTVARGQLREDEQFYTGKIGEQLAATLPTPVTREMLMRGQERFEISCAICHGRTGEGNGMIVQRGFSQPPSLHEQRLRDAPIGYFFDVMTNGYGVMYSYASHVSPEDRWAIAAYLRALQLSQHAAPGDADAAGAQQLEAAQR